MRRARVQAKSFARRKNVLWTSAERALAGTRFTAHFIYPPSKPLAKDMIMANILLAEDETSLRHFITAALEKAGHQVTPCEDGVSAYEALRSETDFDLLLTDIIMPGMDGIELSQRATSFDPALKVMFITGFAAMALDNKSVDTTQTPVMAKPFHLSQLVSQVDEILLQ